MSFAGLGDLLAHVESAEFAVLPPPQRLAIDRALLRVEAGPRPPPPHAIGAGLVAVISALAKHGPVLVAIDDVHWLDAPTLRSVAFALRRLEAQPVTVLATARAGDPRGWSGSFDSVASERVRRLRLAPLSLGALFEVLRPRMGQALTRPLLGSIESASRGNPFYALELARAMEDAEPGAGAGLPVPDDTGELLARRLRRLPRRTREELLRASALIQPTIGTIDAASLQPAVDAEIVRVDRRRSRGIRPSAVRGRRLRGGAPKRTPTPPSRTGVDEHRHRGAGKAPVARERRTRPSAGRSPRPGFGAGPLARRTRSRRRSCRAGSSAHPRRFT